MTKQVLDVQQMQHLQELGLELKETMLYWVVYEAGHENNFVTTKENAMEVIDESCGMLPAYTLQDVLDALPHSIGGEEGDVYWLQIEKIDMKNDDWRVSYLFFSQCKYLHCFQSPNLIDAAYFLLCWAIEQGYVETSKNE